MWVINLVPERMPDFHLPLLIRRMRGKETWLGWGVSADFSIFIRQLDRKYVVFIFLGCCS